MTSQPFTGINRDIPGTYQIYRYTVVFNGGASVTNAPLSKRRHQAYSQVITSNDQLFWKQKFTRYWAVSIPVSACVPRDIPVGQPRITGRYRSIRHDVLIMSWEKLAAELRDRRGALKLTQADVHERGGPAAETLRKLENNRHGRLSPRMRRALEDALEWEPGSIDEVLRGGRPTVRATTSTQSPVLAKGGGPVVPMGAAGDRFALARQVLAMKATFTKHRDQIDPRARDDLIGEVTRSAREAEQAIIALLPWLDDSERGEAITLLAELRAEV